MFNSIQYMDNLNVFLFFFIYRVSVSISNSKHFKFLSLDQLLSNSHWLALNGHDFCKIIIDKVLCMLSKLWLFLCLVLLCCLRILLFSLLHGHWANIIFKPQQHSKLQDTQSYFYCYEKHLMVLRSVCNY